MSEIKIEGLADLHKMMQELPAKIEANVLRGGMRAGAKVIEEEAKRLAPVGPPRLAYTKEGAAYTKLPGGVRESIRVSVRSRNGKVEATIKAGGKKAWYARLVEFGTAAHLIRPKNRKSLFFAALAREEVKHPGAKRKPFMRPALDTKAQQAIQTLADYIRNRLPKEFKKAGK